MKASKLYCGCVMDSIEHSGACKKYHLMEEVPFSVGCFKFRRPLCGMDAYKVNFSFGVWRDDRGRMQGLSNIDVEVEHVCEACLDIATR